MEARLKELEDKVDKLYRGLYAERVRSVDRIIANKITDTEVLSEELDKLLDYIEIDRFADQFWKLIKYVEQFDTYLTTEFRRIEKLLTTGE